MDSALYHPVSSVPLKHSKYFGRICWDASDTDFIVFKIGIVKKTHVKEKRRTMNNITEFDPSYFEDDHIKIAIADITLPHSEFQHNYYHPLFPKSAQDYIGRMIKENKVIKRQIELSLDS